MSENTRDDRTYPDRVLLCPEVVEVTQMPTTTIYARMAQGRFPRPIQLGSARRVGWLESDIMEWLRSQPRSEGGRL